MVNAGNIARHAAPIVSSYLSCEPLPTEMAGIASGLASGSLFTTTYTVTLPAACPTSAWTATYTVSQVCSGDPATWAVPSVLPNFDVTTVVCDVCEEATQTITCPNALGTEPAVINGNGVTMTAEPTRAAGEGYGPGFGPGHGHGKFGEHSFGPGGTEAGAGANGEVTSSGGDSGKDGKSWGSPAQDGHSPVVTAGAGSLKKGLAVVSGLVVLVGGCLYSNFLDMSGDVDGCCSIVL